MNKLTRIAAATIVVLATAFTPTGSFAHAELVASTPAAGSTVQAGNIAIDLEFGEDLMQSPDASGSEIQIISDVTKEVQTVECVTVSGAHLTAQAGLYLDGPVTLTWRTVADDGHPISDSYKFTVMNPSGAKQAEGSLCAMEKTATLGESDTAKDAKTNDSSGGLLGLGVGVAFIVVFSVIGGLQTKRRLDKEAKKNK